MEYKYQAYPIPSLSKLKNDLATLLQYGLNSLPRKLTKEIIDRNFKPFKRRGLKSSKLGRGVSSHVLLLQYRDYKEIPLAVKFIEEKNAKNICMELKALIRTSALESLGLSPNFLTFYGYFYTQQEGKNRFTTISLFEDEAQWKFYNQDGSPEIMKKHPLAYAFQYYSALLSLNWSAGMMHNDLIHGINIMFSKTDQKYLYYKVDDNFYRVPTHGKILKLIDFGKSSEHKLELRNNSPVPRPLRESWMKFIETVDPFIDANDFIYQFVTNDEQKFKTLLKMFAKYFKQYTIDHRNIPRRAHIYQINNVFSLDPVALVDYAVTVQIGGMPISVCMASSNYENLF